MPHGFTSKYQMRGVFDKTKLSSQTLCIVSSLSSDYKMQRRAGHTEALGGERVVAQIGERELSGAGSASEQAQFIQKPNGFTITISSVVRCSRSTRRFRAPHAPR